VDLGTAVDLTDSLLSFDHMHLTARGNEQLAAALVDAVIDLAARSQKTS
jgi:lysophospholipase L1-like esterase